MNKNTRVLVQGITGREGQFHARQCIAYGTNVVAGVTPGKAGQKMDDVPVYNIVMDAVKETSANCSMIFVPPAFAADAILEAADAGIRVIVDSRMVDCSVVGRFEGLRRRLLEAPLPAGH